MRQLAHLLLLTLITSGRGEDKPPILHCTGPEGADAKAVRAAQSAWAKHLGEKSHE